MTMRRMSVMTDRASFNGGLALPSMPSSYRRGSSPAAPLDLRIYRREDVEGRSVPTREEGTHFQLNKSICNLLKREGLLN
ncbi:unnamed protein product [Haemonchus placei]|uniref:Non-specific serine/threonine protein kinase n=1 Tax=Haemonchus placei TaxID=6290 RepID=A0A0N4WIA6_HAEPC|nr:unnamed protein product [Haemonchus placei]